MFEREPPTYRFFEADHTIVKRELFISLYKAQIGYGLQIKILELNTHIIYSEWTYQISPKDQSILALLALNEVQGDHANRLITTIFTNMLNQNKELRKELQELIPEIISHFPTSA